MGSFITYDKRKISLAARLVCAFLAGVCLTLAGVIIALPSCPTEDACRPDYQHHWYGKFWTGVPDKSQTEDPK